MKARLRTLLQGLPQASEGLLPAAVHRTPPPTVGGSEGHDTNHD
jgi:hypothetical protein